MNLAKNATANIQTTTSSSTQYMFSTECIEIEVRFKEDKFSDESNQHIELTLRDFPICANNHSLTNDERSQLVVSFLKGGALELYLKKINPQMSYQKMFLINHVQDKIQHIGSYLFNPKSTL